jgi:hypothetical protein
LISLDWLKAGAAKTVANTASVMRLRRCMEKSPFYGASINAIPMPRHKPLISLEYLQNHGTNA